MENTKRKTKTEIEVEEVQYVTFVIGEELYGVDVTRVQEIIGMTQITSVPNSAVFMRGVINLRGAVVPVVDLRSRFSMADKSYDFFTVIIIVEVHSRLIGMIVDSVSDVVKLPLGSIQSTPSFNAKIETNFIEGIGQIDSNLVVILDVDKILSSGEISSQAASA